ncbi:hypothetical protein D9M68_491260 [compost metagenome]
MHVGVPPCTDVADDAVELDAVQVAAIDLGTQCAHRLQRGRMGDMHDIARACRKRPCRAHRQARFARVQQRRAQQRQRGNQRPVADLHAHARLRGKALGAADGAIRVHVDDMLLPRIDLERPEHQRPHFAGRGGGHDIAEPPGNSWIRTGIVHVMPCRV